MNIKNMSFFFRRLISHRFRTRPLSYRSRQGRGGYYRILSYGFPNRILIRVLWERNSVRNVFDQCHKS